MSIEARFIETSGHVSRQMMINDAVPTFRIPRHAPIRWDEPEVDDWGQPIPLSPTVTITYVEYDLRQLIPGEPQIAIYQPGIR